jgi:hypothetical protein
MTIIFVFTYSYGMGNSSKDSPIRILYCIKVWKKKANVEKAIGRKKNCALDHFLKSQVFKMSRYFTLVEITKPISIIYLI